MGTTRLGLRYPASTNSPNVPQDIQNLATDVDAQLYPTNGPARTTLTINAGWHQAVNYGTVVVYKDTSGLIRMGGTISNDNAFSGSSNPVLTLPSGFRPVHTLFFLVPVNMGAGGVAATWQVNFDGVCTVIRTPAVDANLLWDLSTVVFHPLA